MIDPYKMVLVNSFLLCLTIILLALYRYVFPKKRIHPLLLVVIFSLLPLVSLLRKGVYESGDFNLHIYEAMDFYDNIRSGNLIPRWGGELNATYGYPVFLFAYPLPNYLIVIFAFLGFSFITSQKIFLALAFLISGITMYMWTKEHVRTSYAAAAAIFYLFSPYHLINLHFRVAIGELLSFVFIPLCFLYTKKTLQSEKLRYPLLLAFSLAGLILSHQAVSLATFPFAIAYAFLVYKSLKGKTWKKMYQYISGILLGLGLAAFYWIPVIVEKRYTLSGLFPGTVYHEPWWSFFYSPWRGGFLFQGPEGQYSFLIGYTQFLLVLILGVMLFRKQFKQETKRLAFFCFVSFFIVFFMLLPISKSVWNILPLFNNFQFAYRLLSLTTFFSAIIAGLVLAKISRKYILVILVFLTISYTLLNWGARRMIVDIRDNWLREQIPISTSTYEGNGQSVPKWVDPAHMWFEKVPEEHLEVIKGNANIAELRRQSTYHEYIVQADNNVLLRENTTYFPGWEVSANNKPQRITYTDQKNPGVILFSLDKGLYKIIVEFKRTPIRILGESISILCFILVGIVLILTKRPTRRFFRKFEI